MRYLYLISFLLWTLCAASNMLKMLLKYRPEDEAAKKERLLRKAQAETEGKTVEAKKPIAVKYGLNHVTYLIEQVSRQFILHMLVSTSPLRCGILLITYFPFPISCRKKPSWLLLLMMWTPLSWLYGYQHCVGRWKSHTALWRENLDWEQ